MAFDEQIATDSDRAVDDYVSPCIVRLGSLAELTQGGDNDNEDGFGGAGDHGSV